MSSLPDPDDADRRFSGIAGLLVVGGTGLADLPQRISAALKQRGQPRRHLPQKRM